MKKRKTTCIHADVEARAWTGHYTTVDLEYALFMGYRIVQIYEALAHFELSYVLKKHFEFLAGKKCSSTFPTTRLPDGSEHQCQENCKRDNCCFLAKYVEEVNKSFSETFITKEQIHENKASREYYKLMMNSEIGKFSQNNLERSKTAFCFTAAEILRFTQDPRIKIMRFELMSDAEGIFVQYHTDGAFETLDRNFSCILGAFVTAYARVILHKAIDCLDLANCLIAYCDTDSLYAVFNKIKHVIARLIKAHDTRLGHWKNELSSRQVTQSVSAGPKNYAMMMKKYEKNSKAEIDIKIRGFNFKQCQAKEVMEVAKLKKLLVMKMKNRKKLKHQNTDDLFSNGIIAVPQTSIITKGAASPKLITQRYKKYYSLLKVQPKRTFARKTLLIMTKEGYLKKEEDAQFRKLMKYFTMPFGFQKSDILLLKNKFNYLMDNTCQNSCS